MFHHIPPNDNSLIEFLNVVQPIALIIASFVTIWGINAWRREHLGRKKIDLAEEALIAAYKIKDLYVWIRHPGSFAGEADNRERGDNEEEGERNILDAYYVPIQRIHESKDLFSTWQALIYKVSAVLGEDIYADMETLRTTKNSITNASKLLIHNYDDLRFPGRRNDENLRQNKVRWEKKIGWGTDDVDEMENSIEDAVNNIKDFLAPHLGHKKIKK